MDAQITAAIVSALPDSVVVLAALGIYFVRSSSEKAVVDGVKIIDAKIDTLNATIGGLQGALDVSREHMAGEVRVLDARLQHLERRQAFRPAHGGA